jgi:hypothetical protein
MESIRQSRSGARGQEGARQGSTARRLIATGTAFIPTRQGFIK